MSTNQTHTYHEILSQPSVFESSLAEAKRVAHNWKHVLGDTPTPLIFIGCGSTYYLSLIAAALFRRLTNRLTFALPSGEFLFQREDMLGNLLEQNPKPRVIAISRSGATSETIAAVRNYRKEGGQVLAVTVEPGSELLQESDEVLLLSDAQEKSVVQTRSFSSMLVGLNAIAVLIGVQDVIWQAMQRLPEATERILQKYALLAQELGEDPNLERFYFLGSGMRYGLASEASLKLKEMSLSHSEPFHFLEFRHGPMSMVNQQTLLIGLLSDSNYSQEQALLAEIELHRSRILSLGEKGAQVRFESGIPEEGRGALYLPLLHLLAYYRSIRKGLDPDHPNNLTSVVKLNLE